jgi:hypothetical protein
MELAARHDDPRQLPGPTPITGRPNAGGGSRAMQTRGGGGKDLEQAITVLRARIDEEFRITERLDSKGRQAFALAAAFFAVVQTVAFGAFAQGDVTANERVWLAGGAVLAGLSLVAIAHRLSHAEGLLEEADIRPDAIVTWANEADGDPEYVSARLVSELANVANRRNENNATRSGKYDRVAAATRLALALTGLELLVAIVVRL